MSVNSYELYIDDVKIDHISVGASIIEKLDETFDEAKIYVAYHRSEEPFKMGTKARIVVNGTTTLHYVVNSDRVEVALYKPLRYSHTLSLIEETQMLNKRIVPNLTFFNTYTPRTALERINRLEPLSRVNNNAQTRKYTVDSSVDNATELPEMSTAVGKQFDAMNAISQIVDGVPYIEDGKISIAPYNKKGKLITRTDNIIDKRSYMDLISDTNTVTMLISNGVIENHKEGSDVFFVSPRSETVVISDNDSQIVLKHKIKNITKVELMFRVKNESLASSEYANKLRKQQTSTIRNATNAIVEDNGIVSRSLVLSDGNSDSSSPGELVSVDISSQVVAQERYSTLSANPDSQDAQAKRNVWYYQRGSNVINGLGETYKYLYGIFGIDRKKSISQALVEGLSNPQKLKSGENKSNPYPKIDSPRNYQVRVTYDAYINANCKSTHEIYDANAIKGEIIVGQSSSSVMMDKQGIQAQNLVNRMGYPERTLYRITRKYEQVNRAGDYTNDGYIITACEHVIYNDFIVSIEQYHKDFNQRSMFVGLNQEPRDFDLSTTHIDREINYHDYLIINYTDAPAMVNNSLVGQGGTSLGKEFLLDIFKPVITHVISNVKTYTYDENGNNLISKMSNNQGHSVMLPVDAGSFGKSLFLHFEFDTNTSAGDRRISDADGVGYDVLSPVVYADGNGKAYSIGIEFLNFQLGGDVTLFDYSKFNAKSVAGKYTDTFGPSDMFAGYDNGLNQILTFADETLGTGTIYYMTGEQIVAQNNIWKNQYLYDPTTDKYYVFQLIECSNPLEDSEGSIQYWYIVAKTIVELDKFTLYTQLLGNNLEKVANSLPLWPAEYDNILNSDPRYWRRPIRTTIFQDSILIDKDQQERISFTYQLIGKSGDDNLFLGEWFFKDNPLIKSVRSKTIHFYYSSTETYDRHDTKAKGGFINISNYQIFDGNLEFDYKELLDRADEGSGWPISWAVADENRNIIIAGNVTEKDKTTPRQIRFDLVHINE